MPALPLTRPRRVARILRWLVAGALLSALAFLPFAGRFLVREDPLQPADAILVLAGTRAERLLEGYELWKEGRAPVIVLSPGRQPEPAELELARRGVRLQTGADLDRDVLVQLGVTAGAVRVLTRGVDNTAQEASAFRQMAHESGWTRAIIVTSRFHTRRAGFAFRRAFAGTPVQLTIRASRYDPSNVDRWWRNRADARFVISELQKLVAYRLGVGE